MAAEHFDPWRCSDTREALLNALAQRGLDESGACALLLDLRTSMRDSADDADADAHTATATSAAHGPTGADASELHNPVEPPLVRAELALALALAHGLDPRPTALALVDERGRTICRACAFRADGECGGVKRLGTRSRLVHAPTERARELAKASVSSAKAEALAAAAAAEAAAAAALRMPQPAWLEARRSFHVVRFDTRAHPLREAMAAVLELERWFGAYGADGGGGEASADELERRLCALHTIPLGGPVPRSPALLRGLTLAGARLPTGWRAARRPGQKRARQLAALHASSEWQRLVDVVDGLVACVLGPLSTRASSPVGSCAAVDVTTQHWPWPRNGGEAAAREDGGVAEAAAASAAEAGGCAPAVPARPRRLLVASSKGQPDSRAPAPPDPSPTAAAAAIAPAEGPPTAAAAAIAPAEGPPTERGAGAGNADAPAAERALADSAAVAGSPRALAPASPSAVVYQRPPSVRVHCAGGQPTIGLHCDSEYPQHEGCEVNWWLPLTRAAGTSALWLESAPGAGDFAPIEVEYGSAVRFNGCRCRHFAMRNETGRTRVSVDLRIAPAELWQGHHGDRIGDYPAARAEL